MEKALINTFLSTLRVLAICYGLWCFLWILPGLFLSDESFQKYMDIVWRFSEKDKQDPSRFSGPLMTWLFIQVPVGLIIIFLTEVIFRLLKYFNAI
jgi:hypothetical protein